MVTMTRLIDALPGWLTHRSPAWRDLEGWTLDPVYADDPRTPEPGRPDSWLTRLDPFQTSSGPWRPEDRPAHGIYCRPAGGGLTDWAAAVDGWMIWRWSGPRMHWTSPLVSPWNPILSRSLTLDELAFHAPDLGDWERWIAEAILTGRKPAGYFAIRPRRDMLRWVETARAAGIVVRFHIRGCWAFAAQPGSLGEQFDLAALAAEYRRVLPAELAEAQLAELPDVAEQDVLTTAENFENHSAVVCGLALGYPPEVTAGLLLASRHRARHTLVPAEYGAYCPRCQRIDLTGTAAA
jgi:hypothetical protein